MKLTLNNKIYHIIYIIIYIIDNLTLISYVFNSYFKALFNVMPFYFVIKHKIFKYTSIFLY